jgi:pyruvyl transferase EpsO
MGSLGAAVTTEEAERGSRALISALGAKLGEALRGIVTSGMPVALLDFPRYRNVGDSAIWLGERRLLAELGVASVYTCDRLTFSPEALNKSLPEGPILLSGGGNFGDLWPDHQNFRERVIEAFHDRTIVQLPQSAWFGDARNLDRARSVMSRHPDITLLWRDGPSLELARKHFDARSILCPDMAFALGPLARPERPEVDIVWLGRDDDESTLRPAPDERIEFVDWVHDGPGMARFLRLQGTLANFARPGLARRNTGPVGRLVDLLSDSMARDNLRAGVQILSRARVVITNRLHGHILSVLLDIPHVLLDTEQRKVSSFVETWTGNCSLTSWAQSPSDAVRAARALA